MNLQSRIADTEFVAFDLETTGLHPVAAQIVEIGAVRFRGDGTVMEEFQQLVHPGCDIPADVSRIHGITDAMVCNAPAITDALPRFLEFLGCSPAVFLAHNAGFDVGFIAVAASRLKCKHPTQSVLDTCVLARQRWRLPNYRLETLGQNLGLIEAEKHRALDDALLLKEVFLRLVRTPPAWLHTKQLLSTTAPLNFSAFAAVLDQAPLGYERLWAAIDQGRVVEIQYLGGSTPGATRRITPLGVTEMRGQIYVAAYCHEGQCDKTFRLDRIGRYEVLDE